MNQPSSTTSSTSNTSNDSPAAHAEGSQIVRFAVVQLEYQPAFKNLLFEPLDGQRHKDDRMIQLIGFLGLRKVTS